MASVHRARANIFELQPLEVRRFLTTASITAGNTLTINGTSSGESITVNRNSSNRVTVTGVSTTFVSGSSSGQFNKIVINASGGSDTIFISGNVGSSIPSTISAGDGNDMITTGLADDEIFGQGGFDTVNYSARTSKVTVSLDGAKNDGETQNGETDNVNAEEVIGGSGNDVFTGNDSANYFAGNGGNDEIVAAGGNDELIGNTGQDKLFGEQDNDALYAQNSDVDTVNGGTGPGSPDLDLAEVDGIDVSSNVSTETLLAARDVVLQANGIDPAALDPDYGDPGEDDLDADGLNSGPDLDWDQITAAVIDSQGGVILVGYDSRNNGAGELGDFGFDFVATRYNPDGTHDTNFGGGDGEAVIDFHANPSGNGYADDDFAFGVNVDNAGNIIIVGSSSTSETFGDDDFAICRLDSNGTLDTVFGTRRYDVVPEDTALSSNQNDSAHDVVVDEQGRIVVVGTYTPFGEFVDSDIAIIRLEADGDLDTTEFNGTGMNTLDVGFDEGAAVAMQTSGRSVLGIVVGGTTNGDFLVARFTLAGELDTSFGDNDGYSLFSVGETTTDVLNDIAVNDTNGEIIAVGQSYEFASFDTFALQPVPQFTGAVGVVAAWSPEGTFANHDLHGLEGDEVSFNAITWDADTFSFAVAGSTGEDFVVAKLDASAMEFQADWDGLVLTDFTPLDDFEWYDVALGVGFTSDGKIVVGGYSDTCGDGCIQTSVARYGALVEEPGPQDEVEEVEGFLSYDDVQNGFGAENRSASATFFLQSTHLDDEGNALINLTNNRDVVNIYKVMNEDGVEQIAVDVNGLVLNFDLDTTSITINGKNGNDFINATDDVLVPLFINGENGNDVVSGGGGDDQVNGGAGFDLVTGGAGNDVLLGGSGIDGLFGEEGNDILIGGTANDGLFGGTGEDILIGGTTAYDNDSAALASLMAEWSSGNDNATRIANLRNGGGLNGTNVLTVGAGATVFDDGARDYLTGGNDRDWFFRKNTGSGSNRDSILDSFGGEELDDF